MNPEYVQITITNHQNFMPETLLSVPSMLSVLGYSLTGTNEWSWDFDFIFDYEDPRAEPSDQQIKDWLKLRFFDVEIERYNLD